MIQLDGGSASRLRLIPGVSFDEDPTTVRVLVRATPSIHDELRSRRISFVDVSGAVHLSLPSLLVDRSGVRIPRGTRLIHRPVDPFADRSSLVARTLLETKDRTWGVRELAGAAGVGPATVTRVVRELQRHGVVETRRTGRAVEVRLTDASGLVARWSSAYDWTRNQSVTVSAAVGDPLRFVRRLKGAFGERRFALTLQAGAALVAPHASWDRVHLYVDVDRAIELLDIAHEQGWTPAADGRLVLMKPYHADSVWHGLRLVDGLPVVSGLQLALDLWHYPLRGREQAEHILWGEGVLP